ncbi:MULTISPECIES: hypothetical protein [unclassified Thiomonas]|nr:MULTISPECIES: hypothetical protein [unclassified Thiomonas]
MEHDARLLILHPFPVVIAVNTEDVYLGGCIMRGLGFDLLQTL